MQMLGDAVTQGQTPPRRTVIASDPHFLAYITQEEARALRRRGGGVAKDGGQIMGPAGVPAFADGPGGSGDGAGQGGGDPGAGGGVGGDEGGADGGDGYSNAESGDGALLPEPKEEKKPDPAAVAAAAAKAAQEKLTADRATAATRLREGYSSQFGDALYDDREAAFRGRFEPQIEASRLVERGQAVRGMAPDLQATPLAWSLAKGVDDRAAQATAGLGDAWAAEETRLRGQARTGLDQSLSRLNTAADPMSALNTETQAQLALFQAQQGVAPEYSFALAPAGVTGPNAYAAPGPSSDEQARQERLRLLLNSLSPGAAPSAVVR